METDLARNWKINETFGDQHTRNVLFVGVYGQNGIRMVLEYTRYRVKTKFRLTNFKIN